MSVTELLSSLAHTPGDTQALAARLAAACRHGDCILLSGEVGAGKTSFARGFIQAASSVQDDIVSPTFTLVQTYPLSGGGVLSHYDLYRLKHRAELPELGLDEALAGGVTLIEWPDIAREELPPQALDIFIETEGGARRFSFRGDATTWRQRLEALA